LNCCYLIRAFRNEVGIPPYVYLTQVRIEKAKKLLAKGAPIAEVAVAVGFADQSHLNRFFKRIIGITPGRYAQCQYRSRQFKSKA
ncbi:MAG: helix-turn-helix domain-containing protein, partial [Acidobacteriota bacterium]